MAITTQRTTALCKGVRQVASLDDDLPPPPLSDNYFAPHRVVLPFCPARLSGSGRACLVAAPRVPLRKVHPSQAARGVFGTVTCRGGRDVYYVVSQAPCLHPPPRSRGRSWTRWTLCAGRSAAAPLTPSAASSSSPAEPKHRPHPAPGPSEIFPTSRILSK